MAVADAKQLLGPTQSTENKGCWVLPGQQVSTLVLFRINQPAHYSATMFYVVTCAMLSLLLASVALPRAFELLARSALEVVVVLWQSPGG